MLIAKFVVLSYHLPLPDMKNWDLCVLGMSCNYHVFLICQAGVIEEQNDDLN